MPMIAAPALEAALPLSEKKKPFSPFVRMKNLSSTQKGLLDCQAEELRFNVGDTVYANIGEFTEGRILRTWDEGNPYRVEIQNEEKSNVWVPIDNDDYVRASL